MLKRKKKTLKLNNCGFTLHEVLIAITILVIITIPLAMNMITGAKFNTKAKQTSVSSDLATSLLEVTQTVSLDNLMTDVNGYSSDQYGAQLPYILETQLFKNYSIGKKSEVIVENGKYKPVSGNDSSIDIKYSGDAIRTYFTGQKNEKYAFLLSNVESNEVQFDIVAEMNPKQAFDIVNITSMAQSEVLYTKQSETMDQEVAADFYSKNQEYIALKGHVLNIPSKTKDFFLNNMRKTVEVNINKDRLSEAITVNVDVIYSIETNALRDGDKTIKKQLGSFSTNSTAEFAKGVYIYYYPLLNVQNGPRDTFVINNKNELSTPVYFIALTRKDDNVEIDKVKYTPMLTVNETSSSVYQEQARTTVCSNIKNENWIKQLNPSNGRKLEVKTLGNSSNQQTLYEINLKIYNHRNASFDENGVFTPREKDLITELSGSFVDTSERVDIASDQDTGVTPPTLSVANAGKQNLVYNGTLQTGVFGEGVDWTGITEAINAGTYVAYAKPKYGYIWADGTDTTKTITWEIARAKTATVSSSNHQYTGNPCVGIHGMFIETSGITEAIEEGNYTAYVTPDSNHAWSDGTYRTKAVKWKISKRILTIKWHTGDGFDSWTYDGQIHEASFELLGVLPGESCSAIIRNHRIREVGVKTAEITGLTNPNYELPSSGTTHQIRVYSKSSASIELFNAGDLTYDGTVKNIVAASTGVVISGISSAKNADVYQFSATPIGGYTWPDNTTTTRVFQWRILPKEVTLQWGEHSWVYDGDIHSTTCVVTNKVSDDNVAIGLQNNAIRDVGVKTVSAVTVSNPNYRLPTNAEKKVYDIEVTRAPLATCEKYDFKYDGNRHVGVVAQFATRTGTYAATDVALDSSGNVTKYTVTVTPDSNYSWADGTGTTPKVLQWEITPISDAHFEMSDVIYTGNPISGIFGKNIDATGDVTMIDHNDGPTDPPYKVIVRPKKNHAWYATTSEGAIQGQSNPVPGEWRIRRNTLFKPSFDTKTFMYNGQVHSPTLSLAGISSQFTLKGTLEAKDAGTYTIYAVLNDKSNTTWEDGTTNDVALTWQIHPRELEPRAWPRSEVTWKYDGQPHTGTMAMLNAVSGDSVYFTYSNNVHTNAGSYSFDLTGIGGADAHNYVLKPNTMRSDTMSITSRELTVNWGATTHTYRRAPIYLSPKPVGMTPGDDVSLVWSGDGQTNVGSYTVRITGLQGRDAQNYTLSSSAILYAMLRINPASVTVRWDRLTFTYDGSQKAVSASAVGVIPEDTCHIYLAGHQRTAVGSQTVTATGVSNSNYVLTGGNVNTMTIYHANTTLTSYPKGVTRQYTGSAQTLVQAGSVSAGGAIEYALLNSSGGVVVNWTQNVNAIKATASGTYTIKWRIVITNSNYQLTGTTSGSVTSKINGYQFKVGGTYGIYHICKRCNKETGTYADAAGAISHRTSPEGGRIGGDGRTIKIGLIHDTIRSYQSINAPVSGYGLHGLVITPYGDSENWVASENCFLQ